MKKQKPLKGFTLYLCNNVDYDEVAEALERADIRFQRHRQHFKGSTPDVDLLRKVGTKKWILITADQRQRTRPLERKMIEQFKVREFVVGSGVNVGELIVKARRQMRNLCKRNAGPFVASITKQGNVSLRNLNPTKESESAAP